MSIYRLFVLNSKAVIKSAGGVILNIIGIRNLGTGTGNISNNLIDWRLLQYTDTTNNWVTNNPVLGIGEIAFTSDVLYSGTNQPRLKVGNGTDAWMDLDYIPESSASSQNLAQTLANDNKTGGLDITSDDQGAALTLTDENNFGLSNSNGGISVTSSRNQIDHTTAIILQSPSNQVSQDATTGLEIPSFQQVASMSLKTLGDVLLANPSTNNLSIPSPNGKSVLYIQDNGFGYEYTDSKSGSTTLNST
jgi:hypothetical protein